MGFCDEDDVVDLERGKLIRKESEDNLEENELTYIIFYAFVHKLIQFNIRNSSVHDFISLYQSVYYVMYCIHYLHNLTDYFTQALAFWHILYQSPCWVGRPKCVSLIF